MRIRAQYHTVNPLCPCEIMTGEPSICAFTSPQFIMGDDASVFSVAEVAAYIRRVFKCSVWGECAPSATLKLFSNNAALKTMNLKVKCSTHVGIKANPSKSSKTFKTTYKPFISTSNRNM